ncbi:MAG: MFS transporter [Pirellulaceae bacterium]
MSESSPVHAPAPAVHDPVVAATPFFYGWVMLPVAMAGQIATSPGQTFGISAFNPSFLTALSLSDAELGGAYMLGTLAASPLISLVGPLMDRHGIRRVMTIVVLLFGGACLAASQVTGLFTLFLAFFALRLLGQGALTLLASNTLAMWFHDRLGTAAGVMSLGMPAAFAVVPTMNLLLIHRFGWRWAYAILGLAVWGVMLPLMLVFFRNRPEDIGQLPDGGVKPKSPSLPDRSDMSEMSPEPRLDVPDSLTLSEAMATRAYWILMVTNAAWALVGTGIVFHIVSLFESRGLTAAETSLFFPCFAGSMAATLFLGGMLADRVRLNLLLLVSMLGTTVSVVYLNYVADAWAVAVYAVAQGAAQGLFMVLMQTAWPRYFGRVHLGKIRGTVWTATVAGSSVGPFIMGVVKDALHSYDLAIWLFAGLYGVLMIAALFVTPPRREAATSS